MKKLVVLLENVRSFYNVGSIFRIADGAGVQKLILTGITPYPEIENDTRKPWVIKTADEKLAKTALGAEKSVEFEYVSSAESAVKSLKVKGWQVIILELNEDSADIFSDEIKNELNNVEDLVLIVGNEVHGVSQELLKLSDLVVHIPMCGQKNSLNVSTATAVAVYQLLQKNGE
ncbi:TrmH family RNA methyltransferase [candidate division WWE3 bacterium]|uniref:TrmH family RNA methyltransferase n=1 Tax=candidate division WWE3 bacterium TaxID=2053526 RepID=A0A955RRC4_UNCKA|nr:TrmH family RNA methyltransferase [candidate division WWE3 bacterium]